MRSASPLAPKECRSLPRHQGAPGKISGRHSLSPKLPERRKQRPRRHLNPASVAADINSSSSILDDLNPEPIDRARFPLLASPRSPVSHFVNLTNGLEAVPTLLALGVRDFTLIRLTSTACEQRRHADFLREADASLLAALAAGRVALVWDTSSRERGRGRSGGGGDDESEWREALLSDEIGEEEEGGEERGEERGGGPGSSSSSSRSRAGGGLRVPRALFWGLEFLRYACESRWSGGEEGGDEGGGASAAAAASTPPRQSAAAAAASRSLPLSPPPPPPPPLRAFLGEAGHDVTLDFERALRKEVPDGVKARVRYFRRFYLSRRRQQQQQQQQQQQERRQEQQQPRARGNGGGGGGSSSGDEDEARIRLWGCYRPSRLDRGGGDEAARRAQEELFALAFSSSGAASGAASGDRVAGGGGEEEDNKTCLSLPPPPPPPPFSREALALELADLGWGLFTGGEDRAERLRASRRRRRERAKREG